MKIKYVLIFKYLPVLIRSYQQFRRGICKRISMPECLLDICDINHSGVEDYTPNIFSNISREYHVKEVDKAKGINSNINSEFYCSQYNYWRQRYRPAVQATVKKDNWRHRLSSASLSLKAPPVYKRRSQTHAFDTTINHDHHKQEEERRHRA